MNIISNLPFMKGVGKEHAEGPELGEVESKKERIEFHRRSVRNGPVSFKTPTSGQVKRFKERALARETKTARRRQLRKYHAEQREAMAIRGNLQAAGVISYSSHDFGVKSEAIVRAFTWIVENFVDPKHIDKDGNVELTHEVVAQALTSALNRYQALVGLPVTPLSPAYQFPVALSA